MPDRPARGTRVRYHGTLADLHGLYLYDGLCRCELTDDFDEGCADDLPNRHQLARMDDPHSGLLHVRRDHFTPAAENSPAANSKE